MHKRTQPLATQSDTATGHTVRHSHWPQQLLLVTESILVLVEQAVVLLLAIMSYTILHNACTDIPATMYYASMYYATMYNNMYYVPILLPLSTAHSEGEQATVITALLPSSGAITPCPHTHTTHTTHHTHTRGTHCTAEITGQRTNRYSQSQLTQWVTCIVW